MNGKPARIRTSNGHIVTADAVVVATNSPFNDLMTIHTKQAAYMTYAIGAMIPRGAVATALYWDTLHPYHYVRHGSRFDRLGGVLGGPANRDLGSVDSDCGKCVCDSAQ